MAQPSDCRAAAMHASSKSIFIRQWRVATSAIVNADGPSTIKVWDVATFDLIKWLRFRAQGSSRTTRT
jgi:hypothetical protein